MVRACGRGRDRGGGDGGACAWRAPPQARAQHRGADADHEQARHEVQPRVEVLGQDVLRQQRASRAPSANTPIVCVTVTVAPSATACRARAARADQVGGDHRLAVARARARAARPSRTPRAAAGAARPGRPPRRRTRRRSRRRARSLVVAPPPAPSGAVSVPRAGRDARSVARALVGGLASRSFG